jgi:23S rRNA (uracil1939-C5)-methyltransferase
MSSMTHLCRELDAHPYNPETAHGLRYVIARYSHHQDTIHVVLIVGRPAAFWEQVAERIMMSIGEVTGVSVHINEEPGNAHFARSENGSVLVRRLEGRPLITEKVGEYIYNIGAGEFFQNNISIAEKLQRRVVEVSEGFADRPMLDLYCGVGLFTLALAAKHGWALGVEGLKTAARRAQLNAQENNLSARFIDSIVVDVAYLVKRELGEHSPFVVVDPARRGLEEGVIEELQELQPAGILYVSCSAANLATDLKRFLELGWSVEWTELFDMFPQTPHAESLTLLLPPVSPPQNGWRIPQTRRIVVS